MGGLWPHNMKIEVRGRNEYSISATEKENFAKSLEYLKSGMRQMNRFKNIFLKNLIQSFSLFCFCLLISFETRECR